MSGDMRVIGLVHGTHVLEDIGMDVPYGVTVYIPADKAMRSKDLHRAISSRCIFPLPSAGMPASSAHKAQEDVFQERIRVLEGEIQHLRSENLRLRIEGDTLRAEKDRLGTAPLRDASVSEQKLDAILAALQKGTLPRGAVSSTALLEGAVDSEAPLFIPSEIRMKDAESRIEVRKEETSSTGISDAADKLRKFRKGGQ